MLDDEKEIFNNFIFCLNEYRILRDEFLGLFKKEEYL